MSDAANNKLGADELDEELVAYLDGELEPNATKRMENLLASDARARQRLNQLAVSWDLLDQLPRATVDDLFTKTTVEMVAVAAEHEVAETVKAEPARRRVRWLAMGVATLLALAVGFIAVGLTLPDRNDALLRNLPSVVNLELYRSVGDVAFLKQLQTANLFVDETGNVNKSASNGAISPKAIDQSAGKDSGAATQPAGKENGEGNPPRNSSLATANLSKSLADRRIWINKLEPEQKLVLNREFDRYSALGPRKSSALEQIDQYVQSELERGEQLIRVMQRYHDWLITLTPTERANLSDAVPDKRLALVRQLKQDQENRLFGALGGPNAPQDLEAVLHWMQDFALAHEVEIMEALPDDKRQELKKLAQRGDDRGGKRLYHAG